MQKGALAALGVATTAVVVFGGAALGAPWGRAFNDTEVCFQPEGLEANAVAQSRAAAARWAAEAEGTGVHVSFDDCGFRARRIPMTPGDGGGEWIGRAEGRGHLTLGKAYITYDTQAIAEYGRIVGNEDVVWRHVACHEMGHVLGLDHSRDPDSCLSSGNLAQGPSETDVAQLRRVHGA